MSTPRERLTTIAKAFKPGRAVLKPVKDTYGRSLRFAAFETEPMTVIDTGDRLQAILLNNSIIRQEWANDEYRFKIETSADNIYSLIVRKILNIYDEMSKRSPATKRKTINFIRSIQLDNKHLANFIIELYALYYEKAAKGTLTKTEVETMVEPFEALRKTYGK